MTKRAILLVEGQTEERFVKEVLAPHFWPKNLYLSATLLVTKKVKAGPNFKGGVTSFGKLENDVKRILQGAGDALVTTLIDYYGLPRDCPGISTRPPNGSPAQRVKHVEDNLTQHFSDQRFSAFLALHEFEAWLFSDSTTLPRVVNANRDSAERFAALQASFATPEDINEGPATAPSKRIEGLFPRYQKTLHGPLAAQQISLDRIRVKCAHFGAWLEMLERFAVA
ncbi:hypothetical protein DB30_03639 [Enhygromyxa salina]|uniref:DUF4276 family protein n=1 Tax=Enhygromyxa salina TaxID=215803 RepID=A0A0C2DB35_9BACT|nr:DUF4276 family protein [Enhygromyxa salina]KIG17042.1 hypothetical protein DB30_03639 [Enhygromyxa salina]